MKQTWEKIENAFMQCYALSGGSRKAYLDELAVKDPELFLELQKLLDADDRAAEDSFFEPGSFHQAELLPARFVGKKIGTFTLTKLIGEGGMGAVYLAEQTRPFKRLAAIKIIRISHTSDRLQRRFDLEVQTLAHLSHPNIASVYFSGTTDDGLPYFCMEYVDGLPLDAYCQQACLSVTARITLFMKICRAVHYAHQRGVIHRDLKPANILITEIDGEPQPKIIDFGIAKAVQGDRELAHSFQITATQLTVPGMAIGTLGYMSPEQTLVRGYEIDLRTDVYGLGAIFYEMLVGDLPLTRKAMEEQAWDQTFRAIREERPLLPSRAVLTAESGIGHEANSSTVLLSKRYRGDLDWIVMKALSKEPERRYQSALSLAEDCGRHLLGEPVIAGPPSKRYILSCFVKRNKLISFVSLVFLAGLVVAMFGLSAGYIQAKQAEFRMQEEIETANATIRILKGFITSVTPGNKGIDAKVIDQLDRFAPRIENFNVNDEVRGKLHHMVGESYLSIGEYPKAISHFMLSKEINKRVHGADSYIVFEAEYQLSCAVNIQEGEEVGFPLRGSLLAKTKPTDRNNHLLARMAISQGRYFQRAVKLDDAEKWLRYAHDMLYMFPDVDQEILNELNIAWGYLCSRKGIYHEAAVYFEKVMVASEGISEFTDNRIVAALGLSDAHNRLGDYSDSDLYMELALIMSKDYYGLTHPRSILPVSRQCFNLLVRSDYERVLSVVADEYNRMDRFSGGIDGEMLDVMDYAEMANREMGGGQVFLPFYESYFFEKFNNGKRNFLEVEQLDILGRVLFDSGEFDFGISVMNLAYEYSSDLGHPSSYFSAALACDLARAYRVLGDDDQAYQWGCRAYEHGEISHRFSDIMKLRLRMSRLLPMVKESYPEGMKGLNMIFYEMNLLCDADDRDVLELWAFKEEMRRCSEL